MAANRKDARTFCLVLSLTALGACSGGAGLPVTEAEPGSYEYAKACFVAHGMQALTKNTGPVSASVMDPLGDKGIALAGKEGMEETVALTDMLKALGKASSAFQQMSASDQAEYAAASEAFRKVCSSAQS